VSQTPSADPGALFLAFSRVGLSGFGGVLPFARRMLVEERGWLSAEEFNVLHGLCQFLPGPNVVNLSVVIGARFAGWVGSLAAVAGLLAGPVVIVLLLACLYDSFGAQPVAQGVLRGIAAAGAGLFIAMAVRMAAAVRWKLRLLPLAVLVFIGIALLRWPMPAVMLALLALAATLAWWSLGQDAGDR